MLFTRCATIHCYDLLAKCQYSSPQTTADPVRLSLGPCHKSRCSMSSSSANTEHFMQVGNSHLKHSNLVLMKQGQHIPITLYDASNDFWHSLPAFSSPEASLLLVSTKKSAAAGGESAFLVAKLSLYCACSLGGK